MVSSTLSASLIPHHPETGKFTPLAELVQGVRKIYCCYLSLLTEHLGPVEDRAIPVNAVEKSPIAQSCVRPEEPSEGGGTVPAECPRVTLGPSSALH